jgi:hypothetical protein
MIDRAATAAMGAVVGGGVPLAAESAGLPVSMQVAISAVTGTIGALAALYAFATPRKECELKHHNEANKINAAKLQAESAAKEGHALAREVSEMKGELTGMNRTLGRIAEHLGVD